MVTPTFYAERIRPIMLFSMAPCPVLPHGKVFQALVYKHDLVRSYRRARQDHLVIRLRGGGIWLIEPHTDHALT